MPGRSDEEEGSAGDADDGANDGLDGDFLFIDEVIGDEDHDGRECHERGSDAGFRVVQCHERERDAEERAEDRASACRQHSLPVVQCPEEVFAFLCDDQDEEKSDQTYDASDLSGGEGDHEAAQSCILQIEVHAEFAEDQSDSLSHSGADAEEDSFQGQRKVHFLMMAVA